MYKRQTRESFRKRLRDGDLDDNEIEIATNESSNMPSFEIPGMPGANIGMINIGDMLSRHTNNVLKSTVHRVVNPDKELLKKSRYSIPFFMHPISEMKLNVLDSTICEEFPKAYEDITAGEFLEERLIELGLLKK